MATPVTPMDELDSLTVTAALRSVALAALAALLGALLALLVLPAWAPGLSASLLGPAPTAYWYLARGAGLVGYLLLWLSVVVGLLITNKLARLWPGGPTAVDLHQFASLLALVYGLCHALVLLGDHYIGYSLVQVLLPFGSGEFRPLEVGLGQLAFYAMLPVTLSFYVRQRIGYRAWRLLHYASFGVYLLVGAHGVLAGTDSGSLLVRGMYLVTGGSVYFLTVYRILVTIKRPRALPETA